MPCWVFRYEAEGYESWDALYWARDRALSIEDCEAMCELDQGHAGAHRFARQDDVVLTFREDT